MELFQQPSLYHAPHKKIELNIAQQVKVAGLKDNKT